MTNNVAENSTVTAAQTPFYFKSAVHLLCIGREKASDLVELLHGLQVCPDTSIFQHMFQTLEEHHFIREGFSNDFAQWAFAACNETGLAEKLSGIDIRDFTSVQELRERLLDIMENHLAKNPESRHSRAREPFHFCSTEQIVIPTPYSAHDLPTFVDCLKKVTMHSIHHHFIDARLRLRLVSNDFSIWLKDEMHRPDLGRRLERIDIYTVTLEDVRDRIVRTIENALPSGVS